MTYEEKREFRLQISQLLADAGLNQQALKDMIKDEIEKKVDRAVAQVAEPIIKEYLNNKYIIGNCAERAIREELQNRVINVTLRDINVMENNDE